MKQIIICGANRSGTTSLFRYLSFHPKVSSSYVKQTNYFLEAEMLKMGYEAHFHLSRAGESYREFYKNDEQCTHRLEASPDYLYSRGTAGAIKNYFDEEPILIFILREPMSRIKSWYNYGQQIGAVHEEETFDQFLEKSKNGFSGCGMAYNAFETSNYYKYLLPFYEKFNPDSLKIVFFERLKQNPRETVLALLESLELSTEHYCNYKFEIFNDSKKVQAKNLYGMYRWLSKLYHRFNRGEKHNEWLVRMSSFAKGIMHKERARDGTKTSYEKPRQNNFENLETLINQKVPW